MNQIFGCILPSILGLKRFLLLALWVSVSASGAEAPPRKGKVVDHQAQPVAGAAVEAHAWVADPVSGGGSVAKKAETTTDTTGSFEIPYSGPAGMVLLVRKAGLAPAWVQMHNASQDEISLVLSPPSPIAGVVVDENDKPVEGAEVFMSVGIIELSTLDGNRNASYLTGKPAQSLFSTQSDKAGKFELKNFPTNATANLGVRFPGKALRPTGATHIDPSNMRCRSGQTDVRLVVEPTGTIEGKLLPAEGMPIPSKSMIQVQSAGGMEAGSPSVAESQPDGSFRLTGLSSGSHRVRATFSTNALPDWVAPSVSVEVESGKTNTGVEIQVQKGGILEVVIQEKGSGKPIPKANLNVYSEAFQASGVANEQGVVSQRLPEGDYQVFAMTEGRRQIHSNTRVDANATNRLELQVPLPTKVAGLVKGPDGKPAPGLPVRLVGVYGPSQEKIVTDAEGRFEMPWDQQQYAGRENTACILVRDAGKNLAAAMDLEEDAGSLELTLSPGITLAGKVEFEGKPITNVSAALVFWTGNSGMHLYGMAVGTNVPGRFEIPALPVGRRYGVYVSAPGFGQKYVNAVEVGGEPGRVELDTVELLVANQRLAGQVVDADEKPVVGANVGVSGEGQPNANSRTGPDGRFSFDKLCPGNVHVYANISNQQGNTRADAGDTNVVIRLGETSASMGSDSKEFKLQGKISTPEGEPAVGVELAVFPTNDRKRVKTDTNGVYRMNWRMESWQLQSGGPLLIARSKAKKLAAAEEIPDDTPTLDVKLKPALTITGTVRDEKGGALPKAQVGLWLKTGNSWNSLDDQLASVDAQGKFELNTLPVGVPYMVYAKAPGYGQKRVEVSADLETNRTELEPMDLKLANMVLSGQVLNSNEKPVVGAHVGLNGEDQPDGSATTDGKGRFSFKVCEGRIQLWASGANGYANANAEAGDTNVVIVLSNNSGSSEPRQPKPSLKGKPLEDLAEFGFTADSVPEGKCLLLCVLDVEQRLCRRVAKRLAEQASALKEKGVILSVAQLPGTGTDAFKEWVSSETFNFPAVQVPTTSPKAKLVLRLDPLPYLILTDTNRRVVAEGFPVEDLESVLASRKQ
jgi:protocatechuate 3,4-dioxygenase beta subunit